MSYGFFMVVRVDIVAFEENGETLTHRAAPRYVHSTRENAEREAERLAATNPGVEFMVLEGVAIVHSKCYELPGGKTQVPIYERNAVGE